ncbi:MAG: cytochrome c3 family protein [Bacteroidetes bacterium]|nr:cytochrome c3 family protein [Bacteroidota bacterium]MCH8170262.1 cytochrome c3 family protein [Bacteroidota bacterium]MCH8325089.1 cytochrome c3 family protein [Bacteroidota bacterium]
MKNLKLFFILIIFFLIEIGFSYAQNKNIPPKKNVNNCLGCHQHKDEMPDDFNKEDVHFKAGITCVDCHGGDNTSKKQSIAMDEDNGYLETPTKEELPKFCGKCHSSSTYMIKHKSKVSTDIVKDYFKSKHGKLLKEGNTDVASCVDCHSAHSIFNSKNTKSSVYALNIIETCAKCHDDKELMTKYDIKTTVVNNYKKSVHGIALLKKMDVGAPACNDCHGNHGANPKGKKKVVEICGDCHVNNMDLFAQSKMSKEDDFDAKHGCIACHTNHLIEKPTDKMIGIQESSLCLDCHDEGDKGYKIANILHSYLTKLDTTYQYAKNRLKIVVESNMDDVDLNFMLKEVKQSLIKSRTLIHTFDTTLVGKEVRKGLKLADSTIAKENEEIHASIIRRNGLLIATSFITLIILALFFISKEMDKKL